MTSRQVFLQHVAQTSPSPIGLEIVRAEGVYMWDKDGKRYIDLISGFSVMNMGHGQPAVKEAIKKQVDEYMHLMVYGELIETPQVLYAKRLTEFLPANLDCVYFTNSGAEATEGAMKLAKRVTGRSKVLCFKKAYHGSTQGALSLMGSEYWRNAFRPLLPDVWHLDFNEDEAIEQIDEQTACVVMEVVQAEAGVHAALNGWLKAIRKKCDETGALLVFDEIQTGFGRTGTLWAFEQYGVVPDILLLGKALGAGLPLGAFISSHEKMQALTYSPVLGHISTFAGHPVCCAAGLAGFELLLKLTDDGGGLADDRDIKDDSSEMTDDRVVKENMRYLPSVFQNEQQFRTLLHHPGIKAVRSRGLLMAVELEDAETCMKVCHACVNAGVVTDWFLFAPHCLRIAPPFIITQQEIEHSCSVILQSLEQVMKIK
ncbi:MAG TPA: aspartate aminotransferase family protein [Phnomibacter sp.]|nr:aspartate aminotransferase family protein [Phnomibacter sp.]